MGRVVIADTSNQRIRRIDGTIATIAGTGSFGLNAEGGSANSALLTNAYGLDIDAQGGIIIADAFADRIRRVALDGTITTLAGIGTMGFSGDGGPATRAELAHPFYVTHDLQGRVVFADSYNFCIRRIETNGTITRIAGTGVSGYNGDNIAATSAKLSRAYGVAYDSTGRLIIADTYNHRIRRVELNGNISTVAGTGTLGYNGDNISATTAQLGFPYDVEVDKQDRIIIGDTANNRIRRIESNGNISTIAGTGTPGFNGDGIQATAAQVDGPYGVGVDNNGLVAFADSNNARIRRIETNGTITTIAGSSEGPDGDAGLATSAKLGNALGLAFDAQNRLVLVDTNNKRVRRVEADGTIVNVAGKVDPDLVGAVATARLGDPQELAISADMTLVAGGTSGTLEIIRGGRVDAVAGRYPQNTATGNLARFRTQSFGSVGGVAYDEAGHRIFISETSANRIHIITQVDPANPSTWTIAPLANTAGIAGYADGTAATARFRGPTGLFFATGRLYIADTDNHAIRMLNISAGTVTTLVNEGHRLGFAGDGGPAQAALLYRPTAIALCANNFMFIADTGNNRVRRLRDVGTGAETIITVLGDGVSASSGEGIPSRTFPVAAPRGVSCDQFGNVFVSSTTTVRMLAADDHGLVEGVGSVLTIYGAPPRTSFPSSVTSCLTAVASTGPTTLQISDRCTGLLVELARVPAP
jgi:sugar lactone lactonase YvrE